MAEDKNTAPKPKKPEPKMIRYEVASVDPLRFNIREKEFNLIKGDKIELPEENPYVKTLFAQGHLVLAKSN